MISDYRLIKDEGERQFVKMVAMYLEKADTQYRPFFTDFYNFDWMQSMMQHYFSGLYEDSYHFFGGYEGAERQILCVCPYPLEAQDYDISVLKIEVKTGIGKALSHRDFLGAILGLGIDRKQIGDIVVRPFGAYVILQKTMVDYVIGQLLAIGRYQKIEITEIPFEAIEVDKPKTKVITSTVSSLRVDAVAAVCFGMSRSECVKLIQGEKLRCNGLIAGSSDPVKQGDTLTLRGYGKAKLVSINGQTKKDRLHITIEKYV